MYNRSYLIFVWRHGLTDLSVGGRQSDRCMSARPGRRVWQRPWLCLGLWFDAHSRAGETSRFWSLFKIQYYILYECMYAYSNGWGSIRELVRLGLECMYVCMYVYVCTVTGLGNIHINLLHKIQLPNNVCSHIYLYMHAWCIHTVCIHPTQSKL